MKGKQSRLLAPGASHQAEFDRLISSVSQHAPRAQVRWIPAHKREESGEAELVAELMELALGQPGTVHEMQSPSDLHLAVYDDTSTTFVVGTIPDIRAASPDGSVSPLFRRVLELEFEDLKQQRLTRRLETRARQLERQVEVLSLQHENSLESNYRYHDELRQARDNYARQLEREVERRTAELRRANRELESALDIKDQFLASVSHELRTPMNAVIGMTELLLQTELDAEQREYATHVRASGEALLGLINDILDLSKIEAGKVELHCARFRLRELIDEFMKILTTREVKPDLELSWFVDSDVPDLVIGDEGRLRQVLFNLGSNAIKFTERGEVRILIDRDPNDPSRLRFSVSDTGIGIPQDKHARIFEAFVQADGSTTRKYGGTGLGLAICAQLVELMEGRLWVESQPEQGSTFHFTARLDRASDEAPSFEKPRLEVEGRSGVLFYSPFELNRRFLAEALVSWEIPHRVADSLDTLLEWIAEGGWAAAIIDTRSIARSGRTAIDCLLEVRSDTRLILLGHPSERRSLGGSPALSKVGFLSKPLVHGELWTALIEEADARALAESDPPKEEVPPAAPAATSRAWCGDARPLHVLLAEDNIVNQKLATRLLDRDGHSVTIVNNGQEALDLLEERDEFDVILMDVSMPILDGIDATREIRRREALEISRQYIIALTANAMQGDRERCLDAGMDDYLAKPVRASALQEALSRVPEKNVPGGPMNPIDSENPAFDLDQALDLVEGDVDLLKEVAELFLENAPTLMDQIRDSHQEGDAVSLRRAAHTLKGQAAQLAALKLSQAAFQLEQKAREEDMSDFDAHQTAIRERLEELMTILQTFLAGGSPSEPPSRPPVG
ncbi:MAG: ATP-binding protein [Planctomycetota bacterium]